MNLQLNKSQILIVIILAFLFGGTTMITLDGSDRPINPAFLTLRYAIAALSLASLFVLQRYNRNQKDTQWQFDSNAIPLIVLWLAFSVLQIISGLINDDVTSIRDGHWFTIGIPLIFFYILPRLMKESGNAIVALALVIGHLPYIVISFIAYPPFASEENLYRGIFGNPNQMGTTAVTIAAGLFVLLIGTKLAKKYSYYSWFLIASLICCFGLMYLAFSRTSMLTFLFIGLVGSLIIFYKYPKSLFKIAFFVSFLISLLLYELDRVLLFLATQGISLIDIVQKKEATLSGRDLIWLKTYQDATWWGHGFSYHEDLFGIGAHNSIIKILGSNGLIASYFILLFALASFVYAYFYFKQNSSQDYYAIAPLVITLCFWSISTGENMFGSLGKGITLAYFASLGVMMNRKVPRKFPLSKTHRSI